MRLTLVIHLNAQNISKWNRRTELWVIYSYHYRKHYYQTPTNDNNNNHPHKSQLNWVGVWRGQAATFQSLIEMSKDKKANLWKGKGRGYLLVHVSLNDGLFNSTVTKNLLQNKVGPYFLGPDFYGVRTSKNISLWAVK